MTYCIEVTNSEMRERIDELVEALLTKLDTSGVPLAVCDRLRGALRERLADDVFRDFIVAHMDEPPSRTLDSLVLSYDPGLELAQLAYKN